MSLFKNLFVLLLLAGLYVPANAAVGGFEAGACSVLSEADGNGEDKGEGKEEAEEEPDCE